MKLFLLFFHFAATANFSDSSGFYGIKFVNIDGVTVNTNEYKGKKVFVAVLNPVASSLPVIRFLDSIQRARTDIRFVAVPTADFGDNISLADLINLQKTLALTLTRPLKVKKINGALQHPFFLWLTNVAANKHFNIDADAEGVAFLISGKGTLYSILTRDAPKSVVSAIINQPFND